MLLVLLAQVQGNHTVVVPRGRGYVSVSRPAAVEGSNLGVWCILLGFGRMTVPVIVFPAFRKRRGSRTGSD